jgi:hypothetical protein
MSIFGKPETGQKPKSTADLAAAARHPEVTATDAAAADEPPVLRRDRAKARDAAAETPQRMARERAETPERMATRADAEISERVMAGERPDTQGRMTAPERADVPERMARQREENSDLTAAQGDTDPRGRATARGGVENDARQAQERSDEALEPLFAKDLAESYRVRWTSIQSGFVDDPRRAVRSGDELVAEIMTNLADTFSQERHRLETQLDETGEGSTENLRIALRRYHSFFERLLAL